MDNVEIGRALGRLEEFATWARPTITQVVSDVRTMGTDVAEIKASQAAAKDARLERRRWAASLLDTRTKLVGTVCAVIGAASAIVGMVMHFAHGM